MPSKLAKPCAEYPCPELVQGTRCARHQVAVDRAVDRNRASAAQRGYGAGWREYRRVYLVTYPDCAICGEKATDVDHIRPVTGRDDPAFWNQSNHQALCHSCHSRKTAKQGRWG